jgi:hypothetical protein
MPFLEICSFQNSFKSNKINMPKAPWICAECTLQNSFNTRSCKACGLSKTKSLSHDEPPEDPGKPKPNNKLIPNNKPNKGPMTIVDLTTPVHHPQKTKPMNNKMNVIPIELTPTSQAMRSSSSSSSEIDNDSVIVIETRKPSNPSLTVSTTSVTSNQNSSLQLRNSQTVDQKEEIESKTGFLKNCFDI